MHKDEPCDTVGKFLHFEERGIWNVSITELQSLINRVLRCFHLNFSGWGTGLPGGLVGSKSP